MVCTVAEAVYLANRVVVMSPRPGRIMEVLDVPLGNDRNYGTTMEDPVFTQISSRVRDLLGATHAGD